MPAGGGRRPTALLLRERETAWGPAAPPTFFSPPGVVGTGFGGLKPSMFGTIESAMADYEVVLEPERDERGWWAGAPTVARGTDGTWYLAGRMRETESPRGQRGYEIRLLESDDGIEFEQIGRIHREEAGVPVFERPALVRDPDTGQFSLYACAGLEGGWSILHFDPVDDPAELDPTSAEPVLTPAPETDLGGFNDPATVAPEPGGTEGRDPALRNVVGFKDPFVFRADGEWQMFVIGQDYVERPWHFASPDGETWRLARERPVLPNAGWHDFYTRPASVLPLGVGYLVVYEGSNVSWHSPVYNIATGLAYSPDLESVTDLTPDEPLLTSTTPGEFHTWRYSHWMAVDGRVHVYFEAARPDGANELRVATVDLPVSAAPEPRS